MAISYQQTDTAAPLGVIQACSPVAPAADADAIQATTDGTAGTTELACGVAASSSELCFAAELAIADDDSLDAGTLTMRINITTAEAQTTWEEVHVCRVDSGGTSQETLGSATSMGTDISGGGVFNQNVTLSAASAHNAGDVIYITCAFANSHMNNARSIAITPDQLVDTPFTATVDATGSASLTAGATMAASGVLGRTSSAALSATATMAASGSTAADLTGSASLTATGTMAATAAVGRDGASSLTGTASMSASGTVARKSTAALSGTATVSASAAVERAASASLTGTATLSATAGAAQDQTGAASLTGSASLSVVPVVLRTGAAAMAANASLAVAAAVDRDGAAGLSGTALLTASPAVVRFASAALSGTATLSATLPQPTITLVYPLTIEVGTVARRTEVGVSERTLEAE